MNQTQLYVPALTKANKFIIIALVASLFLIPLVGKLFDFSPAAAFGLSAAGISSGRVYQLLTYPFISASMLSLLFNGLLFWYLGGELEALWGTSRYIFFLAISLLGGGLFYLFVSFVFYGAGPIYSYPLLGCSGLIQTLAFAYGILFPNRIFSILLIFPIKAKYFSWIIILISLYGGIYSPNGIGAWGHLGTIASGFIAMMMLSNPTVKRYLAPILDPGSSLYKPKRKGKGKLKLIKENQNDDDEDKKPPKYLQ